MGWVVLLRGINVGRSKRIPMGELCAALTDAGFADVRSYIQSGNLVLRSVGTAESVQSTVAEVIDQSFGVQPNVHVLSVDELEAIIATSPFGDEAAEEPKHVHLFFLASGAPSIDLDDLHQYAVGGERAEAGNGVLYVFTPDGLARSKLAARVASALGKRTTARNYRSAIAIRDLAAGS